MDDTQIAGYTGTGMNRRSPQLRTNTEDTVPPLLKTYWTARKMRKNVSTIHI